MTSILSNYYYACFQDSNLVVERFKSGFQPPEDIPFEDLSGPLHAYEFQNPFMNTDNKAIKLIFPAIKNGEAVPILQNGYGNSMKPDSQSLTYKGTASAGKSKKRTGIFGIFGNTKVFSRTRVL